MDIIESPPEMQKLAESYRKAGLAVAFVPTMGYFHEGHLELMREGKRLADRLVVSIYVNPAQFSPGEDFERYPRDFERDRKLASTVGADVIFRPSNAQMYPPGHLTYVNVLAMTGRLCGESRPNYFQGVTTICTKLFNIVKPHLAVFGKKDFQQYQVIRRMVLDLNLDLEIVGLATVREEDGLAMSSRNVYLKPDERASALSLVKSLKAAQELYDRGERDSRTILERVREMIEGHPGCGIDYAGIFNTETFEDMERVEGQAVLALAVKVGKTRLIDNHVFGEELRF